MLKSKHTPQHYVKLTVVQAEVLDIVTQNQDIFDLKIEKTNQLFIIVSAISNNICK